MRVIASWIAVDPRNPFMAFLHEITEPILAPIRQFLPRIGMIDLSPLIAIVILNLIAQAASKALIG